MTPSLTAPAPLLAAFVVVSALLLPSWAQAQRQEDVVRLEVRWQNADPWTLEVSGRLEGPPRGRPTGELVLAGRPAPLRVEVAILDRDQGVIEVHLYDPPSEEAGAGSDPPIAKLLLDPDAGATARLGGGSNLRLELLSIGRQARRSARTRPETGTGGSAP